VGSSLVSSACVRPRSAAFGSALRCRSRTRAVLGELSSRSLKIGRSAVRPRPWPPPLTSSNAGFLDLLYRVSSQLSATAILYPRPPGALRAPHVDPVTGWRTAASWRRALSGYFTDHHRLLLLGRGGVTRRARRHIDPPCPSRSSISAYALAPTSSRVNPGPEMKCALRPRPVPRTRNPSATRRSS
jgi:hypothetical protein